ncbi:MAG TPA: hypothetical protein VMR20_16655 [Verrucomicrobiae bacterium]|jgi:hypothetical protein|nr:hypothetical protein [Verrucomicrobiae bacterium]
MVSRNCIYCCERVRFFAKVCGECKKLLARVNELRGRASYGQFLDGLEQTGVSREKIIQFLQADPDGKGSLQDQVAAEMTTELMRVMGISGRQSPQEVKRIRNIVDRGSE